MNFLTRRENYFLQHALYPELLESLESTASGKGQSAHILRQRKRLAEKIRQNLSVRRAFSAVNKTFIPVILHEGESRAHLMEFSLNFKRASTLTQQAAWLKGCNAFIGNTDPTTPSPSLVFNNNESLHQGVQGGSYQLGAAVLWLSVKFQLGIPQNIAFSGQVDEYGQILPVEAIEDKWAAVQKHPQLDTLFISGDQGGVEEGEGIIKVNNLEELFTKLWGKNNYFTLVIPARQNRNYHRLQLLYHQQHQQNKMVQDLLEKYIPIYEASKRPSNRTFLAWMLAEKAAQETHAGKSEKTEQYFKQAVEILSQLGQEADITLPIAEIYNKYAIWLLDQYRVEEADEMLSRCRGLLDIHRMPAYHYVPLLNSRAQYFTKIRKTDEAIQQLQESLRISEETGEYDQNARIYCYMAEAAMHRIPHDKQEVMMYLEEADRATNEFHVVQQFFNKFWRGLAYFYLGMYEEYGSLFNAIMNQYDSIVNNFGYHKLVLEAIKESLWFLDSPSPNQSAIAEIKKYYEHLGTDSNYRKLFLLKCDFLIKPEVDRELFFTEAEAEQLVSRLFPPGHSFLRTIFGRTDLKAISIQQLIPYINI